MIYRHDMDHLLKRFIAELFFLKRKLILNRKINRISKGVLNPGSVHSGANAKKHIELWKRTGSRPNLKWIQVYTSVSGRDDYKYITETDFYNRVEPILNNRSFSDAYADKNSYHRFIESKLLPGIYLRNIEGIYTDQQYNVIQENFEIEKIIPASVGKLITKAAVESGGGRGVELFQREGEHWINSRGDLLTLLYLETLYGKNFLLQEYIDQSEHYSKFNNSSVNTIRLLTYRSVKTGKIIPLQSVLRIGAPGSIVDNQASGGTACSISPEGRLNEFGVNKHGKRIFSAGGIEFRAAGALYGFDQVINVGLAVAEKYFYQRLIGFDLCIDRTGQVKVIEINNRNNEINFFQMAGGPLFREYTDEVVEYCKSRPRSFLIDYEIR